jgi:hypothetical protein
LSPGPLEFGLQIVQIVVGINAEPCAGEFRGIHDAGMDQFVHNHDVIPAEQRGDGSQHSRIAGGKGKRRLGSLERGERFFEFVMGSQRTADEARCARAGSEAFNRLDRGFLQCRFVREAQVVIGGKVEKGLAANGEMRRLRGIDAALYGQFRQWVLTKCSGQFPYHSCQQDIILP